MDTVDIILITSISNLILQPILQYMLHSRCSKIEMCCIKCDREVLPATKQDIVEQQL
jgi:hypothetical protein